MWDRVVRIGRDERRLGECGLAVADDAVDCTVEEPAAGSERHAGEFPACRVFAERADTAFIEHSLSAYATPAQAAGALASWRAFVKDCASFEYVDAGDRYITRMHLAADQPDAGNAVAVDLDLTLPDDHTETPPHTSTRRIVFEVVGTVGG